MEEDEQPQHHGSDLFYIFDVADVWAEPFSRWFQPVQARIASQLASFGLNGAIWAGYITFVAVLISQVT